MHLGRALADATHARLAIPAFQRELLGHPVAAVDLDGAVDDAAEDLARVDLGDRGLHARVLAAVGLPRAVPDEPARRAQLHLGVGEHPLDRLALAQRDAERRALLGVGDRHAVGGRRDAEVARGVREPEAREEVETELEAAPLLAQEILRRDGAVLEDDLVGNGDGADRPDRARREARRPLLDDEAGDPLAALRAIGADEDDAPLRLVGVGDEHLRPVPHPVVAALLPAALDRAGGIGAAARLGDREEGVIPLAQRRRRVARDLRLRPAPDHGRWVAPEDATPGVVEAHAVLGHFLEEHAHGEGAEAAAAWLLGRAETPEPGRLGLAHEPAVILVGQLGRVGIDALLDGNDLVADEAPHLLAQGHELFGEPVAVERGHRADSIGAGCTSRFPESSAFRNVQRTLHRLTFGGYAPRYERPVGGGGLTWRSARS